MLPLPVWGAIGGAIAGGLISAVSYAVGCSINGTQMNVLDMLHAVGTGVVCGAIGGAIGVANVGKAFKVIVSAGVGLMAGISVGFSSESFFDGFWAGVCATTSCYLGTKINMDKLKPLAVGVSTICTSLLLGTPAEMLSVTLQNTSFTNNNSNTDHGTKGYDGKNTSKCKAPGGMTLSEYRAYTLNMGGRF